MVYNQPPFANAFFKVAFCFSRVCIFACAERIFFNKYSFLSDVVLRLSPQNDRSTFERSLSVVSSDSHALTVLSALEISFWLSEMSCMAWKIGSKVFFSKWQ
jgi:hypothetical protein